MAQAKWEMIQESFQAMQGDLRRFRDLREALQLFEPVLEESDRDRNTHEKRRELGLLK
jgi:hypothetical protein